MTDDLSRDIETISTQIPVFPQGLGELRQMLRTLPPPSPLATPGTMPSELPTTEQQVSELATGPGGSSTAGSTPASISGSAIVPGTLTAAAFASSIRPIQMVTGPALPTLPDANFPTEAVIFNLDDGRIYRNEANVWRTLTPETGVGNLLLDPTFEEPGYAIDLPAGGPPSRLTRNWEGWHVFASGGGDAPQIQYAYARGLSLDNPFNSTILRWDQPWLTSAYDVTSYIHATYPALSYQTDLKYVVASLQLMSWTYDASITTDEFTLEIWDTNAGTRQSYQTVDLTTLTYGVPHQIYTSCLRDPTGNGDYQIRFVYRTVKSGSAAIQAGILGMGEPQLHFANTPDVASYSPAIAWWHSKQIIGRLSTIVEHPSVLGGSYGGWWEMRPVDSTVTQEAVLQFRVYADSPFYPRALIGYIGGWAAAGIGFGPGTSGQDVRIMRSGPRELTIDPNNVDGATYLYLEAKAGYSSALVLNRKGAQDVVALGAWGDGSTSLEFGDGTNARDVGLRRLSAGNLQLYGGSGEAGLTITPGASGVEGGQLSLDGVGSYDDWHLDNYQGIFRIFDSAERFRVQSASPQVRVNGNFEVYGSIVGSFSASGLSGFEIGAGTPDSDGTRIFDNSHNLYLQMGSGGHLYVRSRYGATVLDIDANGALVWGNDTNLYRSSANALYSDDQISADTLIGRNAIYTYVETAPIYFGYSVDYTVYLQRVSGRLRAVPGLDIGSAGAVDVYVPLASAYEILNGSTSSSISLTTTSELTSLPLGVTAVQVMVLVKSSTTASASNYAYACNYTATSVTGGIGTYSPTVTGSYTSVAGRVQTGGTNNRQIKYEVNRAAGTVDYIYRIVGYWLKS